MNRHTKTLFVTFALSLLLAGPACSSQAQMTARPDGSVPVQDLSYAPSYKPVDEVAQAAPLLQIAEVSDINSFNRNLKKRPFQLPPAEDGLRDPANEATHILAAPAGVRRIPDHRFRQPRRLGEDAGRRQDPAAMGP